MLLSVFLKLFTGDRDVPQLHDPGREQAEHADGVDTVALPHDVRLQNS